jgi:NitT/TauT family transport system substrate-binding protein
MRRNVSLKITLTATLVLGAWIMSQAVALATDRLKIGVTGTSSDITLFIAEDKGFLAEEGIAPEWTPFRSATKMVVPLGTGELDVGAGAPGAGLYNAAARGVSVKIVADKGSMPPGYGYFSLLVRKDLIDSGKVKTYADLKGLKIGDLSKEGSGDVTLSKALKKGGLKFSDVERLYMGGAQLAVALQNKALDAALITEPSASIAVANGWAVRFGPGDEIYPNQQVAVVLYSENLIEKKRDLAQRFMNAYVKAVRVYNDALKGGRIAGTSADYVIDLLVKRTNIKKRELAQMIVPQGVNPNGCANEDSLQYQFAFYKKMGWVDSNQDGNSLISNSFCKAAVAKLGPYKKRQ